MPWTRILADDASRKDVFAEGGSPRLLSYRDAIREAHVQALELDPRVFVLGEGVDDAGGIFGTTSGLLERFGPDRVMDIPIAENGMTGVAIGAAMTGMRPVFVHMRVDFLPMCMDQIVNHAAKWSYMTGGKVKVPFSIRAIVGRGWGSAAQHSQSLQALFAHVPGLNVVMPASPHDAKGLLLGSIATDCPTIIFEHRWLYDQQGPVPGQAYVVRPGTGVVRREGTDITVAATSYMVYESSLAAEALARDGISVEVVDLRSIRPLDRDLIVSSVRKTGRLVVADTGWTEFGVSAEVAAVVAEHAHGSLKAPVKRIGLPGVPTPASPVLEKAYYPGHDAIVRAVKEIL